MIYLLVENLHKRDTFMAPYTSNDEQKFMNIEKYSFFKKEGCETMFAETEINKRSIFLAP